MDKKLKFQFQARLAEIESAGLSKIERPLTSAQSTQIQSGGKTLLNFCANNYLGLANHPAIVAAAKEAIDEWGFGLASVRFICGTQELHLELESELSVFLKMEESILFSSCFDANGGVFEALFNEEDAIISDELNHASIIDGIRLCKAQRYRYSNRNMQELEKQLISSQGARTRIIVTDGVFSMDGYIAPLGEICDLAEKYGALVMVDDSHAVGFIGKDGRGTPELTGVEGRIDILTGTFGKALGGAAGGYVSGAAEIIALLRQRARPYLFSNTLAPAIVGGTRAALKLIASSGELRQKVKENSLYFRKRMLEEKFELREGEHPIVPVIFGDAKIANKIAAQMFEKGIYITAFSYPVVPAGQARIRVQLSAEHSEADIEKCVLAFIEARKSGLEK